jgi:hypothetical protein
LRGSRRCQIFVDDIAEAAARRATF